MRVDLHRLTRGAGRLLIGLPPGVESSWRERLIALLPVLVPLVGVAWLTGWDQLWRQPRRDAVRAFHAPAVAAEQAVAQLRLAYSDQQAAALKARAAELSPEVSSQPGGHLSAQLAELERAASERGWTARFEAVVIAPTDETAPGRAEPPLLGHTTARGRLTPDRENPQRLASLLELLESLSEFRPRIDLIQIAISADEHGWQGVDVHLRSAHRLHAQPAQ